MWELESKQPVSFVPGERRREVQRTLERHAARKIFRAVAIELSEAYRQAIEMALPDAAVVADKFHVLALAGRALREVHGEKRRWGTVPWLLHRGMERPSATERERVLESWMKEPDMARAWGLKEALRAVYTRRRAAEVVTALDRWIDEAAASGLRPFRRTARTLKKWRIEILNDWRYP